MNIKPLYPSSKGADNGAIENLQILISNRLPDDYVAFLRGYNGCGLVKPITIQLPREDTDVLVIYGTGPDVLDDVYRSEYYLDMVPNDHPQSVAVAHDSGGRIFWLSVGPEDFGVVYFVNTSWPEGSGKVASSWSDFMKILGNCNSGNQ